AIEHPRADFDRTRFLRRLREFEAELDKKESEVTEQRTEIDMFNEVLEARVDLATRDLLAERDELRKQLGSSAEIRQGAEIVGVEMALILLEDLQRRPGLDVVPFRDGGTDALGAHHAREPGERTRQEAVLREQAEKGAEETAEGFLVEPSLQDRDDRLFRAERDEAIGIEADVRRRPAVAQERNDRVVQ